jgi:hypothetical protein
MQIKENRIMKTDTQLQSDVIAELSWEPSIHSEEIGVEVKGGVVTLAGHVGTYSEKLEAERAAMRVFGVKALAVEIDVGSQASTLAPTGILPERSRTYCSGRLFCRRTW